MPGEGSRQMAIMEALRSGACLTTAAMVEATSIDRRQVADACCRLVRRGLVDRRERGCFELSTAGRDALEQGLDIRSGPSAPLTAIVPRRPRRETDRDRLWRCIRMLRKFSLEELCSRAECSDANARKYIGALHAAGYLSALRREPGFAPTSNGFCRWALTEDPGVEAPIFRPQTREVWDPNSRTARTLRARQAGGRS